MAVPTYDELLAHYHMEKSIMKQTFDEEHLREFALSLDMWEKLARFLAIPNPDIMNIKSQGDMEEQRIRMLETWKQRRGSIATYEAMVKALLQISRTDLAEKIITGLRQPSKQTHTLEIATASQALSYSQGSSLEAPTSSASSSGVEDAASSASLSTLSLPEHTAQKVVPALSELEEEFYELVTFIETTLNKSNVQIDTITRRFRMLPQSIRRRHQTDENYTTTRQRILDSDTVKKLFDNLTALKHWNYMMPDTLIHILKDVEIDDIHKEIDKYKEKLLAFKTNTKLRELIGITFPVPDYCMELTMEVLGWEDKTIQEVENRAVNIVRRATHNDSTQVSLGWKGVSPGSIKLMFILMESVRLIPEKLLEGKGVTSVQIDGDISHSKHYPMVASEDRAVPTRLWYRTATSAYQASGGRDVLILAPDPSLPHPEAVPRRPGQLTQEDKLKLQSQRLPPHSCHDESSIINARYELDKECKVIEIKSGQSLSQEVVLESITCLLNTTKNDGVVIHYIGSGRRGTGDWCFEDGFITFRDIAQLYLRASHNFKGRVLTIVSDCSYSGCWVRDCMEFLDEQGVQPCGHKAREKGMVIKVMTSCKFDEIPIQYRYSVSGTHNDRTEKMTFKISEKLVETQTTDCINTSVLNCNSKTIYMPCTLPPGLTWRNLQKTRKTSTISDKEWVSGLASTILQSHGNN